MLEMPEIIRKTAKKFLNDNGSIIEQNPEGAEKSTSFGVLFIFWEGTGRTTRHMTGDNRLKCFYNEEKMV